MRAPSTDRGVKMIGVLRLLRWATPHRQVASFIKSAVSTVGDGMKRAGLVAFKERNQLEITNIPQSKNLTPKT